jgi:acetyltransferase-like isoleucine patch superfamily enzyme
MQKQCLACGQLVDVRQSVVFAARNNARIGSRVSIHPFSYIDATGGVTIGDDVSIAHAVTIMSTEHRFDRNDIAIRDQGTIEKPVTIESDVWIGAGARILGGVTVGQGAVIAAGAVVNRDVPRQTVSAGVPARPIRSR